MPEQKTPIGSAAAPRSDDGSLRATPVEPPRTPPQSERRRVLVIGAPGDIPRALMHPEVVDNRFMVRAVLSVDIEEDDCDEIAGRLGGLLKSGAAETIMVAGPVG